MRALYLLLMAVVIALAPATASAAPERILSVGGSTTEIVFALGAGARLVGVDTTSLYPAAAMHLPNVGYVRQLSAEGVLSLKPDVVLAGSEAGPPNVLKQVETAGVQVIQMEPGYTPEAVVAHIKTIGDVLHRAPQAAALADAFKVDIATVKAEIDAVKVKPRVMFLLQAGRGAMLVSGTDTAANAMIELAGAHNAVTGFSGYKPFSPEAAALAAPDILLMTSDTVQGQGGKDAVLASPALALTPAGQNKRLVTMDALYLAGFGPRLAHALHDLAAKFHPDHVFAPLAERPWVSGSTGQGG